MVKLITNPFLTIFSKLQEVFLISRLHCSTLAVMKRILINSLFFCLFPPVLFAQKVISVKIDGTINPVVADFIHDGIEKAAADKAACLLIHLNTPGGLLKSTRVIVSDILDSPVPVIVYVSPGGA